MVEKVPEKIKAWPGNESWPLRLIGCNINGWNDMNRNNYMKWLDHILNAVAIWLAEPVNVFKTLNDRQSYIFSVNFTNRKKSIRYRLRKVKRSWTALQISSVAFALRWAQKTKPCFVTLRTFFRSTAGKGVENTKWPVVRYLQ